MQLETASPATGRIVAGLPFVEALANRLVAQHHLADSSLPSYDAGAAALLTPRVLAFLDRV